MKKLISKLILLAPISLSLMSCGLDLHEVYEGDGYNSPIFKENYYREYPDEIKPKTDGKNPFSSESKNDHISSIESIEVKHYETFQEANALDSEILGYEWVDGGGQHHKGLSYQHYSTPNIPTNVPYYGIRKRMINIDDQFKYGYLSKLYDGWMFCGDKHQLVRVQMDERGFGQIFSKEMTKKDYFAIQLKSSMMDTYYANEETRDEAYIAPSIRSKIKLYVNFYCRDENNLGNFNVKQVKLNLDNVPTNFPEDHTQAYQFISFSLKNIDLNRCCGYSLNYEFDRADYINKLKNPPTIEGNDGSTKLAYSSPTEEQINRLEYGVMLYEVFMPNSSWR